MSVEATSGAQDATLMPVAPGMQVDLCRPDDVHLHFDSSMGTVRCSVHCVVIDIVRIERCGYPHLHVARPCA